MKTRLCARLARHLSRSLPLALALAPVSLPGTTSAQDGSSMAGRAVAKRFAALGRMPAPEAIVVRDIINYHRHGIPLPKAGQRVALDLRWDAPLLSRSGESVLQIGFATERLHDAKTMRPLNLALVIDRSSSMSARDKMARVKQGLARFVRKLRPRDRLAIIGYSHGAKVLMPSQRVGDGHKALEIIRGIEPNGYTNLHGGLMLGYAEVARHREEEGVNHRVILLTDGLANRGVTDSAAIARDSKKHNDRGIDLSTIGVGTDFNRDLLATLAKSGRGMFHFVADEEDIQKVFVEEAQSLVGIVARRVRLELTTGSRVEIARVYGYQPRRCEGGISMPLENFNYGMTSVVMVKLRRTGSESDEDSPCTVEARLTYEDAMSGRRVTLRQTSRFLDPRGGRSTTDHEVRKNFTIAVLARATRKMAESVKASKFHAAERALSLALEFLRHHYPNTTDKDLVHNRKIVEQYRKILAARIERFRHL